MYYPENKTKTCLYTKCKSWVLGHAVGVCWCVCCLELNMSTRGCAGSSSSLPGIQISPASQANSVLSWAVSFEKLLEDPTGVRYFTVRYLDLLPPDGFPVFLTSTFTAAP